MKKNNSEVIQQGAEALIHQEGNFIIKERIPKSYRIKELDEKIRKHRTKSEKKLLEKASKIINSANPFPLKDDYTIKMPFIKGEKLSEHLNSYPLDKQKQICKKIGEEIAKLHNNNIIHGDLTTSNMIFSSEGSNQFNQTKKRGDNEFPLSIGKRGDNIFLIDFGLGFISIKAEDKAVDLHLLKQALEAKHFENWEILFNEVLTGYKSISREADKILERLKAVEKRGRYKH